MIANCNYLKNFTFDINRTLLDKRSAVYVPIKNFEITFLTLVIFGTGKAVVIICFFNVP